MYGVSTVGGNSFFEMITRTRNDIAFKNRRFNLEARDVEKRSDVDCSR